MNNKITNQMVSNRQKKKRLFVRTLVMTLFMALFTQFAQAQNNVYMHTGSRTLTTGETVNFYDSGGEASGPSYYWERWFQRDEDYTFTFKVPNGYKVKATFVPFVGYTDNNSSTDPHAIGANDNPPVEKQWALRLNTAKLSIYDGMTTENLITTYTGSIPAKKNGNTFEGFTVVSTGAMTFRFESFGYREEGWYAQVELVEITEAAVKPEKPVISFEVCDDFVVINANNKDAQLYYTTDGSDPDVPNKDPLTTGTAYTAPFQVAVGTEVRAIAVLGEGNNQQISSVASLTFTQNDATPTPGKPTITRQGNTITMTPANLTADINETYEVWYTTEEDGAYTKYTAPIEWSTPHTTFYAITRAKSCSDKESEEETLLFDKVQVPDPTITYTVDNQNTGMGTVKIDCPDGYVISYTTNGSDPATSGGTTNSVTLNNVAPGTTIKAIAYKSGNTTDYESSNIVTLICIPGGDGHSGAFGSVVLLDDREDHSWSYYSDGDQPIHKLKPADVKITYFGNSPAGRTTMTNADESGAEPNSFSATASGVKVNVNEDGDQFIYFKTLEAAKEDGSGGYPYTAISNPFQVRPMAQSGTGQVEVTTYNKVTTAPSDWSGTYLLVNESNSIAFAGTVGTSYSGYGDAASVSISNSTISDLGNAAELTVVAIGSYYYLMIGNQYLYYSSSYNGGLGLSTSSSGNNRQWSLSYNNGYIRIQNRDNYYLYCLTSYNLFYAINNSSSVNVTLYKKTTTTTTATVPGYRGFYAWRIKSLSDGLTIANKQVGDKVYADEEITFNTTKEEGNEVEFEALWAQAYVGENTYSGLNSNVFYERNFLVLTGDAGTVYSGVASSIPMTISAIYPNGTTDGTTTATSIPDVGLAGDFSAQSDTKFENILLYNYYQNNNQWVEGVTYTANNHNMFFGRGISEGVNRVCGNTNTGTINGAVAYTIRMESGTYNEFDLLNNTGGTYESTVSAKAVIGCDYDRAKGDNDKLHLAPSGPVYAKSGLSGATLVFNGSVNRNNVTFDWYVKSGKVQENLLGSAEGGDQSIYLGSTASGNQLKYFGKRHITVEGGELASIAGGVNNSASGYGDYAVTDGDPSVLVRMKGGTVRGAVYGAGEYGASSGDVRFVFTGGTVNGWIAGGCNGTHNDGGELYGITYIYMGGKAKLEPSSDDPYIGTTYSSYGKNGAYGGYIFGAGCGLAPTGFDETATNPQWSLLESNSVGKVFGSRIVIADECEVGRDVYGGGNFGFVADASLTGNTDMKSEIYMLGGTLHGDIQGGSNNSNGQTVNIYIKGGELVGRDSENPNFPDDPLEGSVYGGSDAWGVINGPATITMTGGHLHGSVFGGGYGSHTDMKAGTFINISGGTINQNVYGGGEEGTVSSGDTHIEVSGGTMKDVFGAGKGATSEAAKVTGQTHVTVSGGSVVNVFGGGEAGDVDGGTTDPTISTETVTIGFEDNSYTDYITSTGNYAWERTQTNPQSGSYCFRSTNHHNAGTNSSFTMTYNFEVDQTISFYYKVSSENNYDYLNFYVDNTLVNRWSGTVAWTQYNYNLSAGNHTLEWRYSKDNLTNSGDDRAWVDNISFKKVTSVTPGEPLPASYVTISGGNVSGDVFGGGKLGKTTGNVQVNVEGGNVRGSVFGGAYGEEGSVFVAGLHTVNIMGGRVFSNVYGGSRNANDALAFQGYNENETATSSVINISAGQIDQQVYAAGYYGKTFGSVYAFIGTDAILKAPHNNPSFGDNNETEYKAGNLRIANNVWAGGDWGVFQSGSFGAPTVSGYSNIYVDGEGYNTETTNESAPTYMNIAGSIYGCGTSCDAGKQGRTIMVRNYGKANSSSKEEFTEPYTDATRTFYSIQRADTLIMANAHLNFTGQAKIYSLDATEKYAFVSFDKTVRMTGGSSLFLNAPASQIMDFWSASCDDVYDAEATYTPVAYDEVSSTPNKIRVNGGNYIEIYHNKMIGSGSTATGGYGMLNGFAYMMVSDKSSENTCAYARPKQCVPTPIADNLDNPTDGGWVSYNPDENTFSIGAYSEGAWTTIPNTGGSDQIPYENHVNQTKSGEQYFRIWRCGGEYSEREAVVNILANGQNTFDTAYVCIKLPAWRDAQSYYKFETKGQGANLNTTIDYGADVMMYNSAMTAPNTWIHFDEQSQTQQSGSLEKPLNDIRENPNVNFGLVAMPGLAMAGNNLIVCNESDAFLAKVSGTPLATVNKFTCDDFEKNPEIKLCFTYSNLISTNMTWDPMYITLVQVDKDGNPKDIVKIAVKINVATTIDREFITQTYAVMNGTGAPNDEYVAKVVLPTFDIFNPLAEHLSQFKLQSVTFEPQPNPDNVAIDAFQESWVNRGRTYDINHFAMEVGAARNEDNSDGWNGTSTNMHDSKATIPEGGLLLGETGGRNPFAFDFRLIYKGDIEYTGDNPRLGVLTFKITYDNVKVQTGTDTEGNPVYGSTTKTLIVKVEVIRRAKGEHFYLDGQHGSNANNGHYPDQAALSLSTIFNRLGFLPGDIIYIVNAVDVNEELEWSGTKYSGVTIYRYPGGHPLSQTQMKNENGELLYLTASGDTVTTPQTDGVDNTPIMLTGEIVDNEDNLAYEGALVNVKEKGDMIIRDITLDGHKSDRTSPFSTSQTPLTDAGVEAEAPLVNIISGGQLTLTSGATLQENNNSTNGGGVVVADGGKLLMNEDAAIVNNVTAGDGGAVYMAGTLIVSDYVQLVDNTKDTEANNVYLAGEDKVVQIGTTVEDEFGPLSAPVQQKDDEGRPLYYTDANQTETTTTETDYPVMIAPKIGVTKTLYGNVDGYTEVVYVEERNDIAWLELPFNDTPNSIIFHDGELYQLEKYNDPQYLYWIGTWVTVQYWNPNYESDEAEDYDANDFDPGDIKTTQELAWLISYVNGLNGATAHPTANAVIKNDINMDASIWVPIGNANAPFKGTFEGNGHVITGIHSILLNNNAGIFGVTQGATIKNVVAQVAFDGNSVNKGSIIGTMIGGTLMNVEAAGDLVGKENTINMGGLVGLATTSDQVTTHPVIQSSFAVNTMKAEKAATVMGGLVGSLGSVKEVTTEENGEVTVTVTNYYADLYNCYADITLGSDNAATVMGGLVGVNNKGCTVENCYVINPIGPAFAYTNDGTIQFCYAAKGTEKFVGDASSNNKPLGHGTYDVVLDRKELGYMYGDNKVTKVVEADENAYITEKDSIYYANYQILKWRGLLSTLNQWVVANPKSLNPAPTSWLRPTTQNLNGDLPILAFDKDNCVGNCVNDDGKMLRYSAYDLTSGNFNNGLDNMLIAYKDKAANIFLYGNATEVEEVPTKNLYVFINEDAVLLQKLQSGGTKANEANFINTTVGVTFDNSSKKAKDYFGTLLEYDWHLMSTPLADAKLGITYTGSNIGYGNDADWSKVEDSYMPNMTNGSKGDDDPEAEEADAVAWDFYTYFEPQYHWMNFKRSQNNHWHYDEPHGNIDYTGTEQSSGKLTPGRGYMMAINQDSYVNQTGTLNNGDVTINLTISGDQNNDPAPTKDWGSNLVGNPYQAYLNLAKVAEDNSFGGYAAANGFYIYDADNGTYGPYITNASVNTAVPSQFIHPHQAFFVVIEGNKGSEKELKFTYDMATATPNVSSYFRGETQPMFPLVNLFVENEAGSRDLAIVEFNRPELGGVRKVDNLRNANFKLYAHYDGGNYGLLFTPEDAERVPVHFRTMEDGTFTMTWQTMHGTFTNLILVDNLTGTRTNMLTTDHYTFEGSVDDYAARFYITFNVTGVDELNGENDDFTWFDGNDWIVTGKGQLDVIDVTGRVLRSERVSGEQTRLHLDGVAAGVYMMRLTEGNRAKTQKIVIR
jgi:hypothetical protein